MPGSERAQVDKEVDQAFQTETGIKSKLDWHNPKDRKFVRLWLAIRDVVIAKRFQARVDALRSRMDNLHERRMQSLVKEQQYRLSDELIARGLPPAYEDPVWGEVLEVVHLAVEVLHDAEFTGLWEAILPEAAAETLGGGLMIAGSVLAPIAGLYAIGHAHAAGQRGAERNAFKWGFAETVAAMAEGDDWHPSLPRNTILGYQQGRGRNAAIHMIMAMGREVGLRFLTRYADPNGKAKILADMGGYE
jgi:hypothetical protein